MSTDNGQTWSLFPTTTYGAVAEGGDLPHVNVTDLSLSLGNIDRRHRHARPGRPVQPRPNPTATAGPRPADGRHLRPGRIRHQPGADDPHRHRSQIDPADTAGTAADGTPIVTTATPTIDGLSEITGFGNATWVTIVDETPGDSTFGQVIGGFDPSKVTLGQAIAANSGNSTDAFGNFAIPITTAFGSNGLKTIEIYATDDAGAQSDPVTLSFMLQATNIVTPPPTTPRRRRPWSSRRPR